MDYKYYFASFLKFILKYRQTKVNFFQ